MIIKNNLYFYNTTLIFIHWLSFIRTPGNTLQTIDSFI